jgi:hypothetical protein
MTRPRPITQAQREALVKAGWIPTGSPGWWWPSLALIVSRPYRRTFTGRQALRELARRAKRAKGAGR